MLKLVDPSTVPNIVAHLPALTESHELPRVQQVLLHLCQAHPERLQVGLESNDTTVVLRVLPVLGSIGGKGANRLVVSTLTHKIPEVRRQAIQTMMRMKGAGLGDRLTKLITDTSSVVRIAALEACMATDPSQARPALAAALDADLFPKRRREEQVLTLQASTRLGGDEVADALSERLYPESPPWYRSQAGMMGLVALVAAGALALLMWQLSVTWALGIWVAAGVGAWLGGMELVLVEDEETTALVEPAAKCLARIGSRAAIGALEAASQGNWGRAQRLCTETLERWQEIHDAYLRRGEETDDGLMAMNTGSHDARDDKEDQE